ncbi:MAG: methanol utilization protein MoxY [Gammaproteobacteria bacterium]|nr:methanol utilization protein MoxY [Gammaproteobacteria bacterium]
MSLRLRINLFITLLFALILAGGSFFIIRNAREAVRDEIQATAHLTLQLIEIAFASTVYDVRFDLREKVLNQIAHLESARHLDIQLYQSYSAEQKIFVDNEFVITADAPKWFSKLVKPRPIEYRHTIPGTGAPHTVILIRANPSDEITEVWGETKGSLGLLVVFVILANILVYFMLGRGLAPLETILKGLGGIEQGDYRLRLPKFNLPELSRISEKFNLMADVLERSREENRFLTQRSLAIQESERRSLAHELHDELGQSITAIKAVAVSIEQQSSVSRNTVADNAEAIIKVSNRMYDVARNMMRRLRPPVLDELGLITALQEMIDDWNARHQDIFCCFSFAGELNSLGEDINISLYRIVQESLTNIVKHAQASNVDVKISLLNSHKHTQDASVNSVELIVQDNGRGFNIKTTQQGLGLLGMRERTEALNGTFRLTSKPGYGVRMRIVIPVNKKEI